MRNNFFYKLLTKGWGEIPTALPAGDWKKWKDKISSEHPISYWILEEFPTYFWPIKFKFRSFKEFFYYRYFDKYHIVNTHLKPGYYDKPELILHANFAILRDFVEVEKAWMWQHFQEKKRLNFFQRFYFVKSRFRSGEKGLKYLEWETTLEDSKDQAEAAKEIIEMYDWWVNKRPQRKDPYDDVGLNKFNKILKDKYKCDDIFAIHDLQSEEENKIYHDAFQKIRQIEEAQHKEDEDMLIKLIKIRQALWT